MIVCREIQILDLAVSERINEPAQLPEDGTFILDLPTVTDDFEQSDHALHDLDLIDVHVTSRRFGCVEIIPAVRLGVVVCVLASELENVAEKFIVVRRAGEYDRF